MAVRWPYKLICVYNGDDDQVDTSAFSIYCRFKEYVNTNIVAQSRYIV